MGREVAPPDIIGPLGLLVWAVLWDWWSWDGRNRTISRQSWDVVDGVWTGPVLVGFLAGLAWHLVHRPRGH